MICCFTGHRMIPKAQVAVLKETLTSCILKLIDEGANHFIAGGALGFDTLAAETVLEIKKEKDILLEIAIPCRDQEKKWNQFQQARYKQILAQADKVTVLSERYVTGCMHARNKYMVDLSETVIAYYRGRAGGTQQTYFYAEEQNKRIITV